MLISRWIEKTLAVVTINKNRPIPSFKLGWGLHKLAKKGDFRFFIKKEVGLKGRSRKGKNVWFL